MPSIRFRDCNTTYALGRAVQPYLFTLELAAGKPSPQRPVGKQNQGRYNQHLTKPCNLACCRENIDMPP